MTYSEVMVAQIAGLEAALVLVKQQLADADRQQIWAEDGDRAIELATGLVVQALENKIKLCRACEDIVSLKAKLKDSEA